MRRMMVYREQLFETIKETIRDLVISNKLHIFAENHNNKMKKALIIFAIILCVWLMPAFYYIFIKGYDSYNNGWLTDGKAWNRWKYEVLTAEENAKAMQKKMGWTNEEMQEYHDSILDSLRINKPGGVYYPSLGLFFD